MMAQTGNITRVLQLLDKGSKRQRTFVESAIIEIGLTREDLDTKSEKVRNTSDLELRAIIFAVS